MLSALSCKNVPKCQIYIGMKAFIAMMVFICAISVFVVTFEQSEAIGNSDAASNDCFIATWKEFCENPLIELLSPFRFVPEGCSVPMQCPWPEGNKAFRATVSFLAALFSAVYCWNIFRPHGFFSSFPTSLNALLIALGASAFSCMSIDMNSLRIGNQLCEDKFVISAPGQDDSYNLIVTDKWKTFECEPGPFIGLAFGDLLLCALLLSLAFSTYWQRNSHQQPKPLHNPHPPSKLDGKSSLISEQL